MNTQQQDNQRSSSYRRQNDPDLSTFLFGRVPPQARDLEEAVLGALMLEVEAFEKVQRIFRPEVFYVEAHQRIAAAILNLKASSSPVDILTVTDQLRKDGELENVGGAYFVTELTGRVANSGNLEYHMTVIYEMYMKREVIRAASDAVREMFEDTTDVFTQLDKLKRFTEEVESPLLKLKEIPIAKQVSKTIAMMEEASKRSEATIGVPMGFHALDRELSGLVAGDLIVLAARPGMGKTALALNILSFLQKMKIPTDLYSLESKYHNVIMRMLSIDMNTPFSNVRRGNVDWKQVMTFTDQLVSDSNVSIEDTANMYTEDLEARMRLRKRHNNTRVIILDYIQLVTSRQLNKNSNREQEVSQISRMLKKVAMETDATVIALAQLNRSVETRGGDKRPLLSDLRESGAIEQDADSVMFIYRPEYYKIWYDAAGYSTSGIAFVDIAKNRHGATGDHILMFNNRVMSFHDPDPGWKPDFNPEAVSKSKKRKQEPPLRDITEPTKDEEIIPELPF